MNQNNNSSLVIYKSEDGAIQLDVKLENETVWLTQSQMSQLFGVDRTVVVRHIRNIYKDEELQEEATCAKNAQVQNEGGRMVKRIIPYYNLDMIISVGYRINSKNLLALGFGNLRLEAIHHQRLCYQRPTPATAW